MNKKQLTLQNASLFAELERKAKEIEILNIRLEEAEEKSKKIAEQIDSLTQELEKAKAENEILAEQNKELEKAVADAKSKAATSFENAEAIDPKPETESAQANENKVAETEVAPIDLEIQQKINEVTEMTKDSETPPAENIENSDEAEVIDTPKTESTFTSTNQDTSTKDFSVETAPEISVSPTPLKENIPTNSATEDLLRDYGARIIGKVTRVTAEVLSRVSDLKTDASESLKTLALGKNESFKFQIMELAKRKTDPEKTMAEMDLLADEAIVYLRSI